MGPFSLPKHVKLQPFNAFFILVQCTKHLPHLMQVVSSKTTYMSVVCNIFMSAPSDYHKCLSANVA
jgi:hypothetical protein